MNVSDVGGTSLFGVQKAHGHGRHMSMSQRIDKMESAISQAVKDGNLTSDQASQMTKKLDEIVKMLGDAKSSSTSLTSDQSKQIGNTMRGISAQLFAAINPSQSTNPAMSDAATDLFSKIDANGDGAIDKNELADYAKTLNASNNDQGNSFSPASYNGKGTITMMIRQQTTISFSA